MRAGSIEEWIETDFGLPERHFLFVSVIGLRGIYAQCSFQKIAVFELPQKEIVFHFEHEGSAPSPDLQVFSLFPGDRILSLSFATGEINLNMGGSHRFHREWYRPRASLGRSLEFEKVWSGVYDYGTTDNSSWLSQSACGTVSPDRNPKRYRRRIRSFYGTLGSDPPQSWGSPEKTDTEEGCLCFGCGVEIERRQTWERATALKGSLRLTDETARRIDHFSVGRFPFDLPARPEKYRRRGKPTTLRFGAPQHVEVDSPSGSLTLIWDYQDPSVNQLRVMTRGGVTKRSLSLRAFNVDRMMRESFLSGIDSLGWQADERRFFAVVKLGPEDRALLSFAAVGTQDYWERALSAVGEPWPWGFVLTPVTAQLPK